MSQKYKRDDFGDRMKTYESQANNLSLIPNLPVIVRLDGKGFSKYTSGLNKPYDERFTQLMENTCKYLMKKFPKIKV